MKGKKSFAALAAVIMTVSAVSVFPGTAFADGEQAQTDSGAAVSYGNETGSAVMQAAGSPDFSAAPPAGGIQAYTLGRSTSAADGLACVMSPEDYAALTPEQQAEYVVFMTTDKNIMAETASDENGDSFRIYEGFYVKKGTDIWISVRTEKYVGYDILVNGEILDVDIDFALEYNKNFGNWYTVGDSTVFVTMRGRELTAVEKENFVRVNNIDAGVSVYKCFDGYVYTDEEIKAGDYVNCLKNASENTVKYIVVVSPDKVKSHYFSVCDGFADIEQVTYEDTYSVVVNGVNNNEYPVFNVTLRPYSEFTVLSEERYEELSEAEKSGFVKYIDEEKDVFACYYSGETFGYRWGVYPGDYVKKGSNLWIASDSETYVGNDILVNGEIQKCGSTYLAFCEEPECYWYGTPSNFGCTYTVGNEDIVVSMQPREELTDFEKEAYVKVTKLDDDIKVYRAFRSRIETKFSETEWFRITEGDYLNTAANNIYEATSYVIRVPAELLKDKELVICGEPVEYSINADNEAQIWGYAVPEGVTEFTAELRSTTMCGVSFDEGYYSKDMMLFEFESETSDGKFLTSSGGSTAFVPMGTELLVSSYKNLMAGYNFTVNGKPISTFINGDGSHFIGRFIVDSQTIVIGCEEKTELSDYEKKNFAKVTFDQSDMEVNEFLADAGSGDDPHITFDSGDLIAVGTQVKIAVSPDNFKGKKLTVNGEEAEMMLNGDGSSYIYAYTVSSSADVKINLEPQNTEPSVPDTPAAPSRPSTPYIPAAPAAPVAPSAGGTVPSGSTSGSGEKKVTEKSVVKNINKSKRKNISFNAKDTGISSDILTAFAGNKKAQTLTADYGNFSIIISKNDISGSTSEGFDINVSSRKIISEKKLKPLNGFKNARKIVQLNITGSKPEAVDRFTVKAEAGDKLAGKTATVYEYLGGGKLRTVGSGKVDKNGNVSFKTDHIGKYIIAVK